MSRKTSPRNERRVKRRKFLLGAGSGALVGLAGCSGGGGSSSQGGSSGGDSGGNGGGGSTSDSGGTTGSSGSDSGSGYSGTMKIGASVPFKPFIWQTTNGELKGFDVDIAEAIFLDQLGWDEIEWVQTSFSGIMLALNNGDFRCIVNALTITEERDKKIDYSDQYYKAYQIVAIPKDSGISSKGDLKGKVAGVKKGTTGAAATQDLKEEFGGDLTIKSYDEVPQLFAGLKNNQVDFAVNDNPVIKSFVERVDGYKMMEGTDGKAPDKDFYALTVEPYGIGFREDDDKLTKDVNEALKAIRDDGTYDELYNKYF